MFPSRAKVFLWLLFFSTLYPSTLHYAISSNPSRINPILATDSASAEFSGRIFNGLFKYSKEGNVVTDLAQSYEFINATTLIVKLKQNVKWHDGARFGAEDVLFTYKALKSKEVFTPYAKDFEVVVSVVALDSHMLKITYKHPYYKALEIWMMGILPKHLLEHENLMTTKFNTEPIGTNSYIMKGFNFSGLNKLDANKNYFEHAPEIDTITYHFLPDPSTAFVMLKKGLLDVESLTPLQLEKQLDSEFKNRFNIVETQSFAYTYLGFNLRNPKFQNKEIRQALDMAINKQEMVDILYFGHGKVCEGPFLPGSFAYNPRIKSTYDPARAKAVLAKLGYNTKNPLSFTISTSTNNPIRLNTALIIQHQLKKIGVNVKIKAMEWQAFLNTVVEPRKFETILLGWGLSLTPDAYSIWHSSSDVMGGFNMVGYHNAEVDRLIEHSERTVDRTLLQKDFQTMYQLIAEDKPYIFLYIPNSIVAVNKKIKNVEPALIGIEHNMIDWIKE